MCVDRDWTRSKQGQRKVTVERRRNERRNLLVKRSKSSRLRRGGTKSWLVMAAGSETTAVSKQLKQLGGSCYIVHAIGLLTGVARNRISYVRSLSPFSKNRSVLLVRNSLSVKRNILFIKERNIVGEYFSQSSLFHARTLSLISLIQAAISRYIFFPSSYSIPPFRRSHHRTRFVAIYEETITRSPQTLG